MQRTKIKQSRTDKVFGTVVAVIVAFAVFITLYPLIFVLSASISNPMEVFQGTLSYERVAQPVEAQHISA